MDEKTAHLIQRLKQDPTLLRSLMQSGDGQALMNLMTQGDQGAALQRASQSAAKGNFTEMARMLQQIMKSPDGAALVERINKAARK